MSETIITIGALAVAAYAGYRLYHYRRPLPPNIGEANLYFHVKHASYPYTMGKVSQIFNTILAANNSKCVIGLEPQVSYDWPTTLEYLRECGANNIQVMLNVFTSDDELQLSIEQIQQAMSVCNVRWLRFHEALSYYTYNRAFPLAYLQGLLEFSKTSGIPIFWNEWDVAWYQGDQYHPYSIANLIRGYENNVAVSFGTNCNWLEPIEGYSLLQQFKRRGASVQSWYWWERHGRINGYELTMPPEDMAQHVNQAFAYGCEVVQLEPYNYFFTDATAKSFLRDMLSKIQ